VSGATSSGRAAGELAGAAGPPGAGGDRRGAGRRWAAAALAALLVAAGVAGAVTSGVFGGSGSPGGGAVSSGYKTSTATVKRQTLTAQATVNATLGYAGSYTVTGKGGGTLTWLPAEGKVIRQGQVLYRVDNRVPAILLYGKVPLWRTLAETVTGQDVAQLNHDLVALGYSNSADIAALGWDYFGWDTKYALQQLQAAVGMTTPAGIATGTLALGQAVFQPSAIRVGSVPASLGNPAAGAIFTASSARRIVTIKLDASQQGEVKAGDEVSITLPGGTTIPGVISSVGKVATTNSSGTTTITVDVTLKRPKAAGDLVQAPVTVTITTGSVSNVLVVPVTALLSQLPGGYAVEVVGADGTHHLVKVTTGLFDDAAGLVQVSGTGLSAGQRVVVPAI
jgi:hypothetical protein